MSVSGFPNALKKFLFSGVFPCIFLLIPDSKFRRLGLPNRCFRTECLAKIDFSWKTCLMTFGIDFNSFLKALEAVFSSLSLEDRFENTTIFS